MSDGSFSGMFVLGVDNLLLPKLFCVGGALLKSQTFFDVLFFSGIVGPVGSGSQKVN